MADDPTRYLDVSGVLALKVGSTVDVDYTVTHARSVAARDRELGARIGALQSRLDALRIVSGATPGSQSDAEVSGFVWDAGSRTRAALDGLYVSTLTGDQIRATAEQAIIDATDARGQAAATGASLTSLTDRVSREEQAHTVLASRVGVVESDIGALEQRLDSLPAPTPDTGAELAEAAYDAAARANIIVPSGSTVTIDLSKSLNVIPARTNLSYVAFIGTAPGATTYQDGMGTLLKVEGGAHYLQWPSDVSTYGTAPEFGASFASLVVVNGAVNLIWPSTGGGGGVNVQSVHRDDLVSGSVVVPPGGEVVVQIAKPGSSGSVYMKNTSEYTYQYGSEERLRSESLGLLSGTLEASLRGPGFLVGQRLSPDGKLESMARILSTGPWGTTMPEPGGGWLLAELPNTDQGTAPLGAINDANWQVLEEWFPLKPDGTQDRTKFQLWVRWLPGWSPAWSSRTTASTYQLHQYWEPYPGHRGQLLPQITDSDWATYRQYEQSDLEALGWKFPGRLGTKAELDAVIGPPPSDWTV